MSNEMWSTAVGRLAALREGDGEIADGEEGSGQTAASISVRRKSSPLNSSGSLRALDERIGEAVAEIELCRMVAFAEFLIGLAGEIVPVGGNWSTIAMPLVFMRRSSPFAFGLAERHLPGWPLPDNSTGDMTGSAASAMSSRKRCRFRLARAGRPKARKHQRSSWASRLRRRGRNGRLSRPAAPVASESSDCIDAPDLLGHVSLSRAQPLPASPRARPGWPHVMLSPVSAASCLGQPFDRWILDVHAHCRLHGRKPCNLIP